eukprot:gene6810-4890_t
MPRQRKTSASALQGGERPLHPPTPGEISFFNTQVFEFIRQLQAVTLSVHESGKLLHGVLPAASPDSALSDGLSQCSSHGAPESDGVVPSTDSISRCSHRTYAEPQFHGAKGTITLQCSLSSGRLQEMSKHHMPALYPRVVKTDLCSAGSWKAFAMSTFRLRAFSYRPQDYARFPSLACHIPAQDVRFCSLGLSIDAIAQADAHIGQLLWSTYLRWEYLLPLCASFVGEGIRDRSTRYGVPPFVVRSQPAAGGNDGEISGPEAPDTTGGRPSWGNQFILPRTIFQPPGGQHRPSTLPDVFPSIQPPAPLACTPPREMEEAGGEEKMKLYHVDKELCAALVERIPIFGAMAQSQLRAVVQAVLVHILTQHADGGPPTPLSPPHHDPGHEGDGGAAAGHGANAKRKNRAKMKAMWNALGHYWVFNGYSYTCPTLVNALQSNGFIDFMFIRVKNLELLYSWWAATVPRSGAAALWYEDAGIKGEQVETVGVWTFERIFENSTSSNSINNILYSSADPSPFYRGKGGSVLCQRCIRLLLLLINHSTVWLFFVVFHYCCCFIVIIIVIIEEKYCANVEYRCPLPDGNNSSYRRRGAWWKMLFAAGLLLHKSKDSYASIWLYMALANVLFVCLFVLIQMEYFFHSFILWYGDISITIEVDLYSDAEPCLSLSFSPSLSLSAALIKMRSKGKESISIFDIIYILRCRDVLRSMNNVYSTVTITGDTVRNIGPQPKESGGEGKGKREKGVQSCETYINIMHSIFIFLFGGNLWSTSSYGRGKCGFEWVECPRPTTLTLYFPSYVIHIIIIIILLLLLLPYFFAFIACAINVLPFGSMLYEEGRYVSSWWQLRLRGPPKRMMLLSASGSSVQMGPRGTTPISIAVMNRMENDRRAMELQGKRQRMRIAFQLRIKNKLDLFIRTSTSFMQASSASIQLRSAKVQVIPFDKSAHIDYLTKGEDKGKKKTTIKEVEEDKINSGPLQSSAKKSPNINGRAREKRDTEEEFFFLCLFGFNSSFFYPHALIFIFFLVLLYIYIYIYIEISFSFPFLHIVLYATGAFPWCLGFRRVTTAERWAPPHRSPGEYIITFFYKVYRLYFFLFSWSRCVYAFQLLIRSRVASFNIALPSPLRGRIEGQKEGTAVWKRKFFFICRVCLSFIIIIVIIIICFFPFKHRFARTPSGQYGCPEPEDREAFIQEAFRHALEMQTVLIPYTSETPRVLVHLAIHLRHQREEKGRVEVGIFHPEEDVFESQHPLGHMDSCPSFASLEASSEVGDKDVTEHVTGISEPYNNTALSSITSQPAGKVQMQMPLFHVKPTATTPYPEATAAPPALSVESPEDPTEEEMERLRCEERRLLEFLPLPVSPSLLKPYGGSPKIRLRASASMGRLHELVKRQMPELCRRVVKTDRVWGGMWKYFAMSALRLRCFSYTPAELRFNSLGDKPRDVRMVDAYIGQLLWSKYLRWDYLLPTCLQIIGDCIQDRSLAYGVPAFILPTDSTTSFDPIPQPTTAAPCGGLPVSSPNLSGGGASGQGQLPMPIFFYSPDRYCTPRSVVSSPSHASYPMPIHVSTASMSSHLPPSGLPPHPGHLALSAQQQQLMMVPVPCLSCMPAASTTTTTTNYSNDCAMTPSPISMKHQSYHHHHQQQQQWTSQPVITNTSGGTRVLTTVSQSLSAGSTFTSASFPQGMPPPTTSSSHLSSVVHPFNTLASQQMLSGYPQSFTGHTNVSYSSTYTVFRTAPRAPASSTTAASVVSGATSGPCVEAANSDDFLDRDVFVAGQNLIFNYSDVELDDGEGGGEEDDKDAAGRSREEQRHSSFATLPSSQRPGGPQASLSVPASQGSSQQQPEEGKDEAPRSLRGPRGLAAVGSTSYLDRLPPPPPGDTNTEPMPGSLSLSSAPPPPQLRLHRRSSVSFYSILEEDKVSTCGATQPLLGGGGGDLQDPKEALMLLHEPTSSSLTATSSQAKTSSGTPLLSPAQQATVSPPGSWPPRPARGSSKEFPSAFSPPPTSRHVITDHTRGGVHWGATTVLSASTTTTTPGAGPATSMGNDRKLKLYYIRKELCTILQAHVPIFNALPHSQLNNAVESILIYITSHKFSDGEPEECPDTTEKMQRQAQQRKRPPAVWHTIERASSGNAGRRSGGSPTEAGDGAANGEANEGAVCREDDFDMEVYSIPSMTTHTAGGTMAAVWVGEKRGKKAIGSSLGYGYTCEKLVRVLQHNATADFMDLKVRDLRNMWTWWEHYARRQRE